MSEAKAKLVFRVVAALVALVGIANIIIAISFREKLAPSAIIFIALFGLLGSYFLYVAYVCWWQLSPRAIRHACAVVAFYLFGGIGLVLERFEDVGSQNIGPFLALAALISIVSIYFRAAKYVTRLVFGEQTVQDGKE